jgi:DNA topoisomerase-1
LKPLGKVTLIIAEKPDAASRIATALDSKGKPQRLSERGVPFFSANNGELIVVPALGHLYTVSTSKKRGYDYPVFDYAWVPRYQAERGAAKTKVWLSAISKLSENADAFVDACDYDLEGSIIGYTILKYACGNKETVAKRMKYSTLTKEELQDSYLRLLPSLDFAQVEAGLARHEVDWLYGINLSRALTRSVKSSSGQYVTLSTGRVQGPVLNALESREKIIRSFVPTPYWSISAKIVIDNLVFEASYEKAAVDNKQEAKAIVDACKGSEAKIAKISSCEFAQSPPVPFDLGTLQGEAYRLFRYTPMRTSNIAQHLYVNALISYPRTSSQKLPPTIGYRTILEKLSNAAVYKKHTLKLLSQPSLKPHEGEKNDPAHPAIYPTGHLPDKPLDSAESNIYDLVVRRFLSAFCEPSVKQSINVTVEFNGYNFNLNSARIVKEGWIEYYKPYLRLIDKPLPAMKEGQTVKVKKVSLKNEFTTPPARYNPRTLLAKMEKEELGTKATRASTIQTLYDRGYLQGKDSMTVTDLGFEIIEVLRKNCPNVISTEMTRNLEEKMNQIHQGKTTKKEVIEEAVGILRPVIVELKAKEAAIGEQLSQAINKVRLDGKTLGQCPKCKSGKLLVVHSKKTGKRFVGCTNYFKAKCNSAYPLPQNGSIKSSGICKICGYPTISVYFGRKQPWRLCINTICPTKKEQKK